MTVRTGPVTMFASLLWLAAEAGAGFLAVLTMSGVAPVVRFGMHPDLWAGAAMGFAHLAFTSRSPRMALRGAPWRRHVVALLPAVLVLAAAWWGRGLPDARALLMALTAFAIFRMAAAVAGVVLAALSEMQGDVPMRLPMLGAAGGFYGRLDRDADETAHPAAPRPESPMAMSQHTIRDAAVPGIADGHGEDRAADWLDMERLPADWLEHSGALREGRLAVTARRVFDLLAAGGLLLFTLPLLLLAAVAIRLESAGPVFYRQERVGRHGRVFTLFKFRSMTVDAEANGAPVWAVPQDPRVTRVGRLIRLTRIDEIPQVLNVLRGDMAFIGPRPERPAFVAQLERAIPRYADRATVKPGITGWAQVRYRYGASVEDARMKLGYDLYYIRHRSLTLDLRILAATVRVVALQEGAR